MKTPGRKLLKHLFVSGEACSGKSKRQLALRNTEFVDLQHLLLNSNINFFITLTISFQDPQCWRIADNARQNENV